MTLFTALDLVALGFFVGAWIVYSIALEWTARGRGALNSRMDRYRALWMERMLAREVRIIDTQITAALQAGTAFFASTSLIAVGGALTLLRSNNEMIAVINALPLGSDTTALQWEAKSIGLALIFVYAFYKFGWAYRLFNYLAMMIGATPPHEEKDTAAAKAHARRLARLCESAGRHFNRGQRAFFFGLGYLGWFVGPWLLIAATAAVVIVMWRRQFASESLRALIESDAAP